MARNKKAQLRAMLITKYWDWIWHTRIDKTWWIQCKKTGKIIEIGRIE